MIGNSLTSLESLVLAAREDVKACPRMLSAVHRHLRAKKVPRELFISTGTPSVTAQLMVICLDGLRIALHWANRGHKDLTERVMQQWIVAWEWPSFMSDEVISKEPLSAEGIEFQYSVAEFVADLHRLAAFESQGTLHEVEVLRMPGFFSTLVRLWFHMLRHGGSPAALRGISHSLIVFNAIDLDNMDNFRVAIKEVGLVLQDIQDAAALFSAHISRTIEVNTINMCLLNGPLTLMAYALDFNSDCILHPFIACHGPTLVTTLMARLASSKLTYELGNIDDKNLDKHIQGNMAESSFLLCIELLEICIRTHGLPCVIQTLQGRLLPTCFKVALFFKPRSRPSLDNFEAICSELFRRIATFSIYPKVMRLVIKSNKHLEAHSLKALFKSTAPGMWSSWNNLCDTAMQRHVNKLGYSALPRKICNNSQFCSPYILPIDAKRCAGCLSVHYCSRECQKSDWKSHRQKCKSLISARKAGKPMRVNTLERDFAEWMVDLDLTSFYCGDKGHSSKTRRKTGDNGALQEVPDGDRGLVQLRTSQTRESLPR
ncbi:uncharacterized protein EV420DRAFT_751287 [Desarmillaria tabescens]|uniref:MYND-type domain-containing protein n=1 Tax=Armillaria tabescens TaxID=1929756 RepID=A0AA39MYB4_ARMTA|nr:uncharacterized protein EV420DRAFT_751287 [Desarmillaria tabescens]KAK0450365.1 hypothetical protein EV420DRAFT_751287 [Desarmillaria tabescens]